MDITTWGDCHFINDETIIVYKKSSSLEYHIKLHSQYQEVEVKSNNKTLLKFKDTINQKNDLSSFTRVFSNQEYIVDNNKVILKKIHKKVQFLNTKNRDMYNSKKIISMDLETRVINGIMSSYCVSVYDGKGFGEARSFYLSDYSNEKEMLRASILYLMKRKYHNHKIYLHNFSRFDSVFLLSVITDLSNKVYPIIRDGNIINLSVKFADKYILHFIESLLLLPGSLRSLAISFEVENKGIFPYKFVNNSEVSLNYIGNIPEFKYFDNISKDQYIAYSSNTEFNLKGWDLRKETIKYCEFHCFVLYQIINNWLALAYQLIIFLNYLE